MLAQSPCVHHDVNLTNLAGGPGEGIGDAMDLHDATLVVGTYAASAGPHAPKAVVFVESSGVWSHQAALSPSDGAAAASAPVSVAVHGDIAVVGARLHNHTVEGQGAVYVFERTGSSWTEVAEILAPDASMFAHFGSSVAFDGETLVVGAPGVRHPTGWQMGRVYFYEVIGGVWTLRANLDEYPISLELGSSVAVDGDRAIVGAEAGNDQAPTQGSAFLYKRTGGVWAQQTRLVPPFDPTVDEHFGRSVDIEANRVVIGAPDAWTGGPQFGEVHVFTENGNLWSPEQVLVPSDGQGHDRFGHDVSLVGGRILVGAWGHDGLDGTAYFFGHDGSSWSELGQLTSPQSIPNELSGSSVAMNSEHIAVGAPSWGNPTGHVGTVAIYHEDLGPLTYCVAKLNSQGCFPSIRGTGAASATSSDSFLIEADQVINNKVGIFFYGQSGRSSAPFQGGTLCVQGPHTRTQLQPTGGNAGLDDCSGSLSLDFNAWIQSGVDASLVPGSFVNGQYYFRDPLSPVPTGLTDGIEFYICP